MPKRRRDLQGLGLAMLNRIAGSPALEKLHLQKPAEQALFQASRTGFKVASLAGRPLQTVRKLLEPARLEQQRHEGLFDLSLSDEQTMLVESLRRFADERLRNSSADAESHSEVSEETWNAAMELGLCQMAVPEALGGAGSERSPVTSALITEALAWGDMGQALALLAPVSVAHALADWGNAEQQLHYLSAFAQESPPDAALALLEPTALYDPERPGCRGRAQDGGWLVSGEKSLVPLGPFAQILILSADLEGLGPRLILLEGDANGLHCRKEPAMGLRAASLGRLKLKEVTISAGAIIGDENTLAQAVALARLGWCALAIGCAQAVLDYVGPYANERQAFGEPISHRQGVAFTIADMAIEIEAMRLLLWRAAARAEQGMEYRREALLAYRFCADKAMQIGSNGVQMLGGHDFVKEHPVERWYRDLRATGLFEGGLLL